LICELNPVSNRCEGKIKTNSLSLAEREAVASRLQQISKAIADAPDVDEYKVRSIKDALSRGAYRIDPRRIADKLIRLYIPFRPGS